MTAFNIVRCRVKPGREEEFLAANRNAPRNRPGFRRASIVKTDERAYCFIGEWTSFDKLVAARPMMIEVLDTFRDCLEDLDEGLGVTDPVSGEAMLDIRPSKKASKRKNAKRTVKKASSRKKSAKQPTKKKVAKRKSEVAALRD